MTLVEGQTSYCTFYEKPESPIHLACDYNLWLRPVLAKMMSLDYEYEESDVEMRARLGRQIVSNLPIQFRENNKGRFIAVTFRGRVLSVCDTLESLNRELAGRKIEENYYIERIGYTAIAQV
jgi:hypothetical protein